ncbi:hypothetical protein Y032_0027g1629 [Ancylostoma ceylanicum]|uniref:Uncharacterized protein n=1 Tax=Ancylostoma ceylanicum TaxID=53326 RepID=A0A016UW10_9BILA|nr:hypothetical protein Y032_0027g1629 [Ancylostoma ceylanicum]
MKTCNEIVDPTRNQMHRKFALHQINRARLKLSVDWFDIDNESDSNVSAKLLAITYSIAHCKMMFLVLLGGIAVIRADSIILRNDCIREDQECDIILENLLGKF